MTRYDTNHTTHNNDNMVVCIGIRRDVSDRKGKRLYSTDAHVSSVCQASANIV